MHVPESFSHTMKFYLTGILTPLYPLPSGPLSKLQNRNPGLTLPLVCAQLWFWQGPLLLIAPRVNFWLPFFCHLLFPNSFCWPWFLAAINFSSLAVLAASQSRANPLEPGTRRPPWEVLFSPGPCGWQSRAVQYSANPESPKWFGVFLRCPTYGMWRQLKNC